MFGNHVRKDVQDSLIEELRRNTYRQYAACYWMGWRSGFAWALVLAVLVYTGVSMIAAMLRR